MNVISEGFKKYGIYIALIFVALLFQYLTNGVLFLPPNVTNLVLQNSYILIMAIGMTLVIVTGRIDLSVGSIVALAGAISGILIAEMGLPTWLVIIVVLVVGAIIGAWHGFWIAYRNIPFFVVTLAGMMLYRGLTMIILDGRMRGPFPADFRMMAAGFIPDFFGGINIGGNIYNLFAIVVCVVIALIFIVFETRNRMISKKYELEVMSLPFFIFRILVVISAIGLFAYWFSHHTSNGIPNVLVILGILIVIYSYMTNRTIMGRHIYATGGNPKTAELSGIKTKQVVFWVYVNMGVLASLAGLVFTARADTAVPRAGVGFELQVIAAAFIGGASPHGGVGKVLGAITGAMIVGIINNGMGIMGVSVSMQEVVTGLVLLAAVIFNVLVKDRKTRVKHSDDPEESEA